MNVNKYEIFYSDKSCPILTPTETYNLDIEWEDYPFPKYGVAQALYECTHLNDYDVEHGYIVALNENEEILGFIEFCDNDENEVGINEKEVIIFLVMIGASSFIFCHNHPIAPGEKEEWFVTPSINDVRFMGNLFKISDLLKIEFIESLIFTKTCWISMWEGGKTNAYLERN